MQHFFEASHVSIVANSEPLDPTEAFPYLGRTIAYNNIDSEALYKNIIK